jgi:hypothetical protein
MHHGLNEVFARTASLPDTFKLQEGSQLAKCKELTHGIRVGTKKISQATAAKKHKR